MKGPRWIRPARRTVRAAGPRWRHWAGPAAVALTIAAWQPGCTPARQNPPSSTLSGLASDTSVRVFDHHVHALSPRLVAKWKALGVPFSKPDYAYSDIDSIMEINRADGMFLLSMAYLYGTDDFTDADELRNVRDENDYVDSLAATRPGRLYSFCSVNPLRDYAADELRRCRAAGAAGLKLHFSSSDVSLRDPAHLAAVRSLCSVAARLVMPVLVHFDNQRESFGVEDARVLIDSLILPLEDLEITIAHLGTSGGYNDRTRMILGLFADSLESNPALAARKVWLDISAVGLTETSEQVPPITPEDFADLSTQLIGVGLDRVVFGTDYPIFNTSAYVSTLESNTTLTRDELAGILCNGVPAGGEGVRKSGGEGR